MERKVEIIPPSKFKRITTSFFRAHNITYPLSPENLAEMVCPNGTRSEERTRDLIELLFGIELVENKKKEERRWFASIDKYGNAQIISPSEKRGLDFTSPLEKETTLQLEHEFGHLLYWAMMDYLGELKFDTAREIFQEKYCWDFAFRLRCGDLR